MVPNLFSRDAPRSACNRREEDNLMIQLGIFAKYWAPGAVKTRLAVDLGTETAAELYRAFLVASLRRFAPLSKRCLLAYTPAERADAFAEIAEDDWQIEPQSVGDLGARMRYYFEQALARDADGAILLGSDSPTLPIGYARQAIESLSDHDVVLGPSTDGGYYLIGLRGQVPDLFHGIEWSTETVWRQTTERLEATDLRVAVLPEWYDVDCLKSYRRLCQELATTVDPLLIPLSQMVGALEKE